MQVNSTDRVRKWRENNPDRDAEQRAQAWRKYEAENKETERERKRQWFLQNKEKKAAAQRAYRERKKQEAMRNLLENER